MYISSGGVAKSTTVGDGGRMYISSGGVVLETTVNDAGHLHIFSGGVANFTTVSRGYMYVDSGGTASSTTVNGYYNGYSYLTGDMYIYSGGTASSTTVNEYGNLYVLPGGMANSTTVNSGGYLYVYDGGTATIVFNPWQGTINSGAAVTYLERDAKVYFGDSRLISKGDAFIGTTLNSGESALVFSGGVARETVVSRDADLHIHGGGKLTGLLTVRNGATVYMEDGSILDFDISVISAGAAARVNNLSLIDWDDAPDFTITVSMSQDEGKYILANNAYELSQTFTVMTDAGNTLGTITVGNSLESGDTTYTLVLDGGVLSFAVENAISGEVTGSKTVSSGSVASDVTINSGGNLDIVSGGAASATVVNAGGALVISSGGAASSTTLNSGGSVAVRSGGSVADITVNAGGALVISSGGAASQVTVSSGGTLGGFGFAVDKYFDEIVDGSATVADQVVIVGNGMNVFSGGSVSGITVNDGADMLVSGGGIVADTVVSSGGAILISSGGKVTGTLTIADGAVVSAYAGSIIDFDVSVVVPGGAALINDLSLIQGTPDFTVTVSATQGEGTYKLAEGAAGFAGTVTVVTDAGSALGTITVGGELISGNHFYSLVNDNGALSLIVTIDTIPPVAPVAFADITAPTNSDVTVTATFSDDSAQKQYSMDGDVWIAYTAGVVMTANGVVYFRGIDAAGNISDVASYEVTNIDKVKPVAPVALADITAPTNGDVTVSASFSDDSTVRQYSRDNSTWQTYTTGVVMDANGMVYFRGIDAAGNVSDVASYEVTNIDKVNPVAPVALADITTLTNQNVTVSASFSDDSTVRQYSRDNSTWQTYTTGVVMDANGMVYFRGIDAAGNVSDVASYEVTNIDKVKPVAPVALADITAPTNGDVTVTASFSDDSTVRQYSRDNSTWQVYTAGVVMDANGVVYFRGIDAAGNISDVASYKVANIDKVAPVITLTGDNVSAVHETALSATVDDGSKLYYRVDGANWQEYAAPITVTANAVYEFEATDAAGNTGNASMTFSNILPAAPEIIASTPDAQSWSSTGSVRHLLEYSTDGFEHALRFMVDGAAIDSFELPSGTYEWRVRFVDNDEWSNISSIVSDNTDTAPKVVCSDADGVSDLFFANAKGTWESNKAAQHLGSGAWKGTKEVVSIAGKNRLSDLFIGSTDANVLLLTDDANGDALFVDDIYTALPGSVAEQQSRIAEIGEIRAGVGDDVVDMTSQRFTYTGSGLTIRGGAGDDVIWANKGNNFLFGDSGNDRLVGASGNDILTGGVGDDSMHGGGGIDVFTFCENWGVDTVEQLAGGTVTLWFASGSLDNWDAATLTYTDGTNSVTVKGTDNVTLKFGDDGSETFAALNAAGAFAKYSSEKIFEEYGKGVLATL